MDLHVLLLQGRPHILIDTRANGCFFFLAVLFLFRLRKHRHRPIPSPTGPRPRGHVGKGAPQRRDQLPRARCRAGSLTVFLPETNAPHRRGERVWLRSIGEREEENERRRRERAADGCRRRPEGEMSSAATRPRQTSWLQTQPSLHSKPPTSLVLRERVRPLLASYALDATRSVPFEERCWVAMAASPVCAQR